MKTKTYKIRENGSLHVGVVYGGMSDEREISLLTGENIIRILLNNKKYAVTSFDQGDDISEIISHVKPDVIFNALHGRYGEDGVLPAILDLLRIPYTHCGQVASSLNFNKKLAKILFKNYGLNLPRHTYIKKEKACIGKLIEENSVIKPLNQGSSIGVKLILKEDRYLINQDDFKYGDILIEEYIKGQEIHVAVMNGKSIGTIEIKPTDRPFNDYIAKYHSQNTQYLLPGNISIEQIRQVEKMAETANHAIKGTGIVRAEFILSEQDNRFYLLEINTHPGFTRKSMVTRICEYNNISLENIVDNLIDSAQYEK